MSRVSVEYRLHFDDGVAVTHTVDIDTPGAASDTGPAEVSRLAALPEWTRLDEHQCPNCPYPVGPASPADSPARCPVASRLAPLVDKLDDRPSHEEVEVDVRTSERRVQARTSLQRAVSSLFGLIIASSDCPHTRFLLPMARYHLPLASESETVYRVAGMYLVGRYLRRDGRPLPVDDDFDELHERYRQLGVINRALAARLRQASDEDASVNAVILLDLLARLVPDNIERAFDELRHWYHSEPDAI